MQLYEKNRTGGEHANAKTAATSQLVSKPAVPFFQRKEKKETNDTGLPDSLKTGMEQLSGTSLSGVKVHYGSNKPAQFKAHAYAQGSDIHLGPGQEKHLAHEAWHVVQQKKSKVQPTSKLNGIAINDDPALELEADQMGEKASNFSPAIDSPVHPVQLHELEAINGELSTSTSTAQLAAGKFITDDGQPTTEGQVTKSAFLDSLKLQVQTVAREILEPAGLAQSNCPDLNYWLGFYQAKDAAYTEQAIKRYAPATTGATSYQEFLDQLTARVKQGLIEHVKSGSTEVEPGEAPQSLVEERPDTMTMQKKDVNPIQFGLCCTGTKIQDAPPDLSFDSLVKAGEIWAESARIERAGETPIDKFKREHPEMLNETKTSLSDSKYLSTLQAYERDVRTASIRADDNQMSDEEQQIKKIVDNTYPRYQGPLRTAGRGQQVTDPTDKTNLAESMDIVKAFEGFTPVAKSEIRYATVFPGGVSEPKNLEVDKVYTEHGFVFIGGERPSDSGHRMSIEFVKCYKVDATNYYGHRSGSEEKMQWITLPGAQFQYLGFSRDAYRFKQIPR